MNHLCQPKLFTHCFLPLVGNALCSASNFQEASSTDQAPTLDPAPGGVPEALRYTRHSSCPGGLTSQEPTKLGFHRVLPCDISWLVFSKNYLFCKLFFLLCWVFVAPRGLFAGCGTWASHCIGFLCFVSQAPERGLQQWKLEGLAAWQYAGSSQPGDGTVSPT